MQQTINLEFFNKDCGTIYSAIGNVIDGIE